MSARDEVLRIGADIKCEQSKIRDGMEAVEIMQIQRRQHDRILSFSAGQIAAYQAVLHTLKPEHQAVVIERITALRKQTGDLA